MRFCIINFRKLSIVVFSILLFSVFVSGMGYALLTDVYAVKDYQPIYNGNKSTNKIAITCNVYEGDETIRTILDVCQQKGITITFFVGGVWAKNHPQLLREMAKNHEIGSHGYNHLAHDKMSLAENLAEMKKAEEMIEGIICKEITLFAPPSGAFNDNTLKACEQLGYKTIMWSKDTIDWRDKDERLIFKRATNKVSGGEFILIHPKKWTAKVFIDIVEYYTSINLIPTTVSNCLIQ